MPTRPLATPGAKMMYLIRRRPRASRDELIVHWFANHMPGVIAAQKAQQAAGRVHAWRYVATLFDPDKSGAPPPWDGVAQLWFDRALPRPEEPYGARPTDSFQEKAEPYVPWPTTEYVVIDGSEQLPVEPLTLDPPFPCTRSGFTKLTFLVKAKAGAELEPFLAHWLDVHVPNVRSVMQEVGGIRYVVSQSLEPDTEPYAGMAELYFADRAGWKRYRETVKPDGMERWVDPEGTVVLRAQTELIGIP